MQSNRGFTLVEMLVVITIIGILIVALVPLVRNAQIRAKEAAVKTQCASIEASLATYAQNHNGNFPAVAIDVMAPFADHALSDPAFYDDSASLAPPVGVMVNGILGGYGHYNNSTANVFEQIKNAKDTPLAGNEDTPRYFDVLMATDATQEYPANPFLTTTTGERARMRNIFVFSFNVDGGFDPLNNFSRNESNPANALYSCGLYVPRGGANSGIGTPDIFDSTRVTIYHQPLGVPLGTWTAPAFSTACEFGTDEFDYFSPGDFAYVPIMSSSAYSFGDSAATLENEYYKWGTSVTGYMLFAYGHKSHKNNEFEDEQREFVSTGLPGYGDSGVDTIYENYVLQLFEGSIYFSKQY